MPGILFRPTESLFDTSYGSAGSLTVPVIHGSNMVSNYDAGILLPDGAVVTGLTIYVYDNDASCNLYALVKLKRRANTSTTAQDMSSCVLSTTGESTSIQSATTTTVDNATVDNAAYQYHLHAYFSATSSYFPTHFYGCRIEYTLKALRP